MIFRMRISFLLTLSLVALLATACGKDAAQHTAADGTPDKQLPTPTGASGGVTGMPDRPGPGPVGPPVAEQPEVPVDENGTPLLPEAAPVDAQTAAEPTPEDAVAVIRDYYDAINSGDFVRAYGLWSDGGRSSGQSAPQFAAGFADITGVSVEIQSPGAVDAAAGSRYIEVPVAITTTRRDGSQHRLTGTYTLRRAVVDGATPEQRQWRIGSADLRETQ
jgi:hypothetical protein